MVGCPVVHVLGGGETPKVESPAAIWKYSATPVGAVAMGAAAYEGGNNPCDLGCSAGGGVVTSGDPRHALAATSRCVEYTFGCSLGEGNRGIGYSIGASNVTTG